MHRHAVTVLERSSAPGLAGADTSAGVPWILLAHGFGTEQSMWGRLLPHLPTDTDVVLMDHVGAGRSDLTAYQPHRYHSLRAYADDVVEVVEAAAEQLERPGAPVHYVGHSAGGMIGALAAVERPELFASLTLIGASARYVDAPGYRGGFSREAIDDLLVSMEDNYVDFATALAPMAMANPDRPELAEELASSFKRVRAGVALDFARAIFLSDFREDVRRVDVPTLVLQAASDPMVPPEAATHLHEAIVGSRLRRIGASGHFPHMSGPAETAEAIVDFLAEVTTRTGQPAR